MKNELNKNGVCLSEQQLKSKKLNDLIENINLFMVEKDVYNVKSNPNNTYRNLRTSNKIIINRRIVSRDGDEGLIDIWNIDKALSDQNRQTLEQINKYVLNAIEQAFRCKYKLYTHNLYINNSVKETRGIHADADMFPARIKSFLFLTDVPDESYGPFSYIEGSHLQRGKKYHRKYDIYEPLNEIERDNYVIYTGIKKGDLVIAAVSGAHRGLPQDEGRLRMIIVSSYDPA